MQNALARTIDILALRPPRGLARERWSAFLLVVGTGLAVLLGYRLPPANPPHSLAPLLSVLLYQPAIEELLFRGVVQGELLARPWGRPTWAGISMANLVTTAAFASIHLVHHGAWWALAVTVPSLVFGMARERTASVVPALILHIAFNAGYFGGALLGPA